LQCNKFALLKFPGDRGSHATLTQVRDAAPKLAFSGGAIDGDIDSPVIVVSGVPATWSAHFRVRLYRASTFCLRMSLNGSRGAHAAGALRRELT